MAVGSKRLMERLPRCSVLYAQLIEIGCQPGEKGMSRRIRLGWVVLARLDSLIGSGAGMLTVPVAARAGHEYRRCKAHPGEKDLILIHMLDGLGETADSFDNAAPRQQAAGT